MKKLLFMAALLMVATACSKGGNDSKNEDKNKVIPNVTHKAEECPSITGEFVRDVETLDDDGEIVTETQKLVVKTSSVENGINLQTNDDQWTINGKSHSVEKESVKLEYLGTCDKKSVIINVFKDGELQGVSTFSLNENGQLVKVVDSKRPDILPSGTEIWDPKQ